MFKMMKSVVVDLIIVCAALVTIIDWICANVVLVR
jgi:hypothetical protein